MFFSFENMLFFNQWYINILSGAYFFKYVTFSFSIVLVYFVIKIWNKFSFQFVQYQVADFGFCHFQKGSASPVFKGFYP